jgi:hypothetical protein
MAARSRAIKAPARYHHAVDRPTTGLLPLRRVAWLVPWLAACVEIDPSYADSSLTSTTASSSGTTASSSGTTASSDDASSSGTPACDCTPLELCEAGACTQPARVLYVSLDGVITTFGNPDATQDVQGLYMELAGTWDPYGADAATRALLLDTVEEQWAPLRVVVTDTRPPAGPYLMAVVTATPPPATLAGVAYVAYPDCGDAIPADVTFVFASPSDGVGAAQHASWVSGSFGRALGLRYNDSADDIMGFGNRFVDACQPTSDGSCATAHPELCGNDPMQQSSLGELAALVGLRG